MQEFTGSKLTQKNTSRWVHLDKLVMLMAAFVYSIVDLIISFKGVSLNELSEDERSSYGAVLAFLSSFFIYATFSEFTNSHKRYKHSVNKYHRLGVKLGLYQAELARDKSKMHWESLYFNLKSELVGGGLLTPEIINKVFPSEGKVDFEMYLFLAWEQYVAKREHINKMFHLIRVSNSCCKVPTLGSNYALLSMFVVDLVLSAWGLDPFENTNIYYPPIFLAVFLVLMGAGFKLVNWSQKQMIANDKPEFLTKKFHKLRSLLEQYRLSHPEVRVDLVKVFSIGELDEGNGESKDESKDESTRDPLISGGVYINPLVGSGSLNLS